MKGTKQHIDAELKIARNEMGDFLTLTRNEVVEFLDSERMQEDGSTSVKVFNRSIDILVHNFKAKYFL